MKSICTITSQSHLPQTMVLRDSVLKYAPDLIFNILITDCESIKLKGYEKTKFFTLYHLEKNDMAQSIIKKYKNEKDKLRWSLKAVFLTFLLTEHSFQKVIYVDNDICFFNDFNFLFSELEQKDVLLCPHWRCNEPEKNKTWFLVNFTDGLYNAGFIGITHKAIPVMIWWAKSCLFKCAKIYRKGLFDDQKYLDFIPVLYENTGIIRHRGCNVAYWNRTENKRIVKEDKILINGVYEIVFIHFTKDLIKSIRSQKDKELTGFLNLYECALKKQKTLFSDGH